MIGAFLAFVVGTALAEEPTTEAPAAPAADTTVTTLVAAGSRPKALRVAARKGDTWELQLRRSTTMTQQLDDGEVETLPSPEAVNVVRVEIGDRVEARLVDADLEGASPAGLAALRDDLADLTDVRLVTPLDPRQLQALDLIGLPEEIGQFAAEVLGDVGFGLRTTTVPLPEEPVGVGGSWTWSRPSFEQGVALTERFTAHLVERRGSWITLKVEMKATPDAPIVLEGADTATIEIGASGKVWLDLRRPLPRAADVKLTGSLTTTWTEDGVAHRGVNGFGGHLTIASRDAR